MCLLLRTTSIKQLDAESTGFIFNLRKICFSSIFLWFPALFPLHVYFFYSVFSGNRWGWWPATALLDRSPFTLLCLWFIIHSSESDMHHIDIVVPTGGGGGGQISKKPVMLRYVLLRNWRTLVSKAVLSESNTFVCHVKLCKMDTSSH